MLAKVSNALLLVMAGKALFLLLVMAMMADKASAGGLFLTLGFSAGLPQPQDCPRFLDSLEVGNVFFKSIHRNVSHFILHQNMLYNQNMKFKKHLMEGLSHEKG